MGLVSTANHLLRAIDFRLRSASPLHSSSAYRLSHAPRLQQRPWLSTLAADRFRSRRANRCRYMACWLSASTLTINALACFRCSEGESLEVQGAGFIKAGQRPSSDGSRYNRGMGDEPNPDQPPRWPWAAGAALLLAAGLLTAGGYGVYRQTIIAGSVIGACAS